VLIKFCSEMLREGFLEEVSKSTMTFRIVEKLAKGSYCECVLEDGVCYIQVSTKVASVATNTLFLHCDLLLARADNLLDYAEDLVQQC
jgi:hypothetical protein